MKRSLPALLLTLLAVPLSSQQEAATTPTTFADAIEVDLVTVEVRVADRQGRPITGLGRGDFRLFEDGHEVEITNFVAVGGGPGRAVPSSSEVVAGLEGSPAASAAPDRTLRLTLYIDNDRLRPGGRARVLAGVSDFLERHLEPDAEVMVVVQQQGSPRILLPWSDEPAVVEAALAQLTDQPAGGLSEEAERRTLFAHLKEVFTKYAESGPRGRPGGGPNRALTEDIQVPAASFAGGNPCQDASDVLEELVRTHARSVRDQVTQSIVGLTRLTSALAAVPGRKVVIYAGGGLEQWVGLDLFHYLAEICPGQQQRLSDNRQSEDLSGLYTELTAHANANGVTFYTLEGDGLTAAGDVSEADSRFRLSATGQSLYDANRETGLFQIAQETGGKAVLDANRFEEPLAAVARDLTSYYSLAFSPGREPDGALHRLRVEVDAPHRELRYRRQYRHKSLAERLDERLYGSLLVGEESNPLDLSLDFGELVALDDGTVEVPVELEVPLAEVTLLPAAAAAAVGRLRLVMTALDAQGRWQSVRQKELRLSPQEAAAGRYRVVVRIDLPPGRHQVAVGVHDEIGGTTAFVRRSLDVAVPTTAEGGSDPSRTSS